MLVSLNFQVAFWKKKASPENTIHHKLTVKVFSISRHKGWTISSMAVIKGSSLLCQDTLVTQHTTYYGVLVKLLSGPSAGTS